jgi:uncharacterized protein affecting Mg2+/Co2+ transport
LQENYAKEISSHPHKHPHTFSIRVKKENFAAPAQKLFVQGWTITEIGLTDF